MYFCHKVLFTLIYREDSKVQFNFTNLDKFMNVMNKNQLYPGFEIMGTSNKELHFQKGFSFWLELCQNLTARYLGKLLLKLLEFFFKLVSVLGYFSKRYISKWRFETWNEPDLKMYNTLKFDIKGN